MVVAGKRSSLGGLTATATADQPRQRLRIDKERTRTGYSSLTNASTRGEKAGKAGDG